MNKIVGKFTEGNIDVKRFYLPGISLESCCPKCGMKVTRDFGANYISYPVVGKPEPAYMYCEECDEEWRVSLILDISVRVAPPKEDE